MTDPIGGGSHATFTSTTGEYGCFSNFSRHTVFLKGKRWPTTEHFFQAHNTQVTRRAIVRACLN